ncbi:hypothetical protein Zmor_006639 [Zophobas morio]|uniref:Putative nuclease HARBI1 n=1 Tax=Zophobas morio TaxID=2755281 RepID=A0AA38IWC5_9CUCU|nr:hypothetical protein Zmor_006639 [Zophobas morio]
MEFDGNEELEDLAVLNFLNRGIPRTVYQRQNFFDVMDDISFRKRFRLSRQSVLQILMMIDEELEFPYDINNAVSPMNQLLLCLRYYSTGGHLQAIADFSGTHVSTACRIMKRVTEAVARHSSEFIKFETDQHFMKKRQQDFFEIASFPRVSGAIDCTHIKIQSPGGNDAEIFRNRKGYFSINVQMVCDRNLKILNVVSRWPGSAHDATIFTHSRLCREFESNMFQNCLLLGDSGYGIKNYLFTPLLNPITEAKQLYNESHIRTRNPQPVLHNIAINMGEEQPPPLPEELEEHILEQLINEKQIPRVPAMSSYVQAIFAVVLFNTLGLRLVFQSLFL